MVLSNLPPQPFIYFPQSQPPGIVAEGSCVPLFQNYNVIGQANALLLGMNRKIFKVTGRWAFASKTPIYLSDGHFFFPLF